MVRARPQGRIPVPRGARTATLLERIDLTSTLARFRFELEGGVPAFEAGQYLPLGVRLRSGRILWRPYSIASSPLEHRHLELYVRWAQHPMPGRLTSRLWRARPGDPFWWKAPRGTFRPLDPTDPRRRLFVGGGTGISPFVSAVLTRAHGPEAARVTPIVLCHGASRVPELGYAEELRGLAAADPSFQYLPTISRLQLACNAAWRGEVGRVEALLPRAVERVSGAPLDPATTRVAVCGFEGTVEAVLRILAPLGFRHRRTPREDGSWDVDSESYG